QNDDTSRVLSGAPSYSRTPQGDPVDLALSLSLAVFLIIILYESERGLIRQRSDRPCLERMPLSEEHLGIFMSLCLVISGEVQVDIRLLISLEPKEGLEGNIKSRLHQFLPAHRAVPVRHIIAAAACERAHFL